MRERGETCVNVKGNSERETRTSLTLSVFVCESEYEGECVFQVVNVKY
jgi:hypothetical protein